MKLRLCFFMLALGICGAVVQGCDDNDDNLDVLDKLQPLDVQSTAAPQRISGRTS